MSAWTCRTIVAALAMAMVLSVPAQDRKAQLKKEQERIQREIEEIESLISATRERREESLHVLQSIEAKIAQRRSLIDNMRRQIEELERSIGEKASTIEALESDLERLKQEYAQAIYHSYKRLDGRQQLSFIFSAGSFNEAWQRFRYLRSYAEFRRDQARLIRTTIGDIERTIETLEAERAEKQALYGQEVQQARTLENEKAEKNDLISRLQEDEETLREQVERKNAAARELNAEIERIIAEEIRRAREEAEREAADAGRDAPTLALTPEEVQLSRDFVSNKGRLPWPVERGHVVGRFGRHEHPTLRGVYIDNNGTDIKTEPDAPVRAIFGGQVVNTFYLPTTQNSIIIKHGEYYSVYSNLITASVTTGDVIDTKEPIGTAYTEETEGFTSVHLEIWKGTRKLDPETWLTPSR